MVRRDQTQPTHPPLVRPSLIANAISGKIGAMPDVRTQ